MGSLNLKRFRADLKASRADRTASAPGRPASTGAMALVRDNLDRFDAMRAEDPALTWADIAVALDKQGVRQRDGQPMTAKRLCALISTIRKQRASQQKAAIVRDQRGDVANPRRGGQQRGAPEPSRLTLAPDLDGAKAPEATRTTANEEGHRRAALDRAKAILKKD